LAKGALRGGYFGASPPHPPDKKAVPHIDDFVGAIPPWLPQNPKPPKPPLAPPWPLLGAGGTGAAVWRWVGTGAYPYKYNHSVIVQRHKKDGVSLIAMSKCDLILNPL